MLKLVCCFCLAGSLFQESVLEIGMVWMFIVNLLEKDIGLGPFKLCPPACRKEICKLIFFKLISWNRRLFHQFQNDSQ